MTLFPMNADPHSIGADPNQPPAPPAVPVVKHDPKHLNPGEPARRDVRRFDASERFRNFQPPRGYSGGMSSPAAREHARGRHNG